MSFNKDLLESALRSCIQDLRRHLQGFIEGFISGFKRTFYRICFGYWWRSSTALIGLHGFEVIGFGTGCKI